MVPTVYIYIGQTLSYTGQHNEWQIVEIQNDYASTFEFWPKYHVEILV